MLIETPTWVRRLPRGRTLLLLMLGAGLALAACSHAPVLPQPPETAKNEVAPSSTPSPTPPPQVPEAGTGTPTTDPLGLDAATEPPEPKTAEEAVAIAVAEQNLLDRMRAGFVLSDADHVAVDREVSWFARHDDYLDRTFRRAERYLFFIVEELEARKMPLELALLPIVESAFNPVALSRARAAGLWQFIPSTGRRYGLEQNPKYDGRRDVMESTRAALDYLQVLANEFDGDWYHAVAAYNAGEMNVSRAIARNRAKGKPIDFFSLDLPRETRAYVPKLLAMRRIVVQPEKYGLEFGHIANQPYFAKIKLDGPIDLGVAAQLANMSREDLIALNPAYHRAVVATDDGSGYLLVPTDRAEQLRAGLAALQSPEQRVPKIYYTVHRDDTVSSVARKLGVTPAELVAANKIKGNTLRLGQELVIDRGSSQSRSLTPDASGERFVTRDPSYVPPPLPPPDKRRATFDSGRHKVRDGETLSSIARVYGVSVDALAAENKIASTSRLTKNQRLWIPQVSYDGAPTLAANDNRGDTIQRTTYVVRAGDTLSRIAKMFHVQVHDLLTWNKMSAGDVIKAGQKLFMYAIDTRRSGG